MDFRPKKPENYPELSKAIRSYPKLSGAIQKLSGTIQKSMDSFGAIQNLRKLSGAIFCYPHKQNRLLSSYV